MRAAIIEEHMTRAFVSVWLMASLACGETPSGSSDEIASRADARGVEQPDAPPPIDDTDVPHKIVFATSSKHDGDFGGLEGADAACAEHAAAAGLEGSFLAWLSAPDQPAGERLAHAEVPYARTDGARVAEDWADLVDGELAAPIDRDEEGAPVMGDAWTGTLASGEPAALTCAGFDTADESGVCGSTAETGPGWTDSVQPPCTAALRLYCVEQ